MPKLGPGPLPKSVIDADAGVNFGGGTGNFGGDPSSDTGATANYVGLDHITLGCGSTSGDYDVLDRPWILFGDPATRLK